ncbi:Transcription factor SPT20 homolog-like 1 [Oopsacas minuta]|uniref:Transcription factor SPT20 homolog-like 1 n=1 Tax=Oopsacas minuta TaxID=111878 RepID=A0AAV7JTE6_9METZ|nr:Transcription factor SPT20 homolog-like 1 [Oopsacas minuta]
MENTPVKDNESSPSSSTKLINTPDNNNNKNNPINNPENKRKNTLADTNLIPESHLLRKFVSLHSPDCLLVKMYLQQFSISLLKQGSPYGAEVTLQYQEWTFFDYLEAGHIPPYLFNYIGRSDLTLYEGCVIVKLVNCRFQKAAIAKTDTSPPDTCTHYLLLRPTPEIITHQTNLMLLQSSNLHTQHPYTIRHRALQIESALTQKISPPLCLDTSIDVLITANYNQFQRFKYNHPRLKRLRCKFAKFNTQTKQSIKQCTSSELRLVDYLSNTAYLQGCRKSQKYSLLGSSLKECISLKSSTSVLSKIAISRPERAIETAINHQLQRRGSYSDQSSQHYQTMSQLNFNPNKIAKSHISLQNPKEMRRPSFSLENPRLYHYSNSSHPEAIPQFRNYSASTPGTPPVEPFTPLEEQRYSQINPLESSHLIESAPANSMSTLHTHRNSFHTPSSMTSSEMHLRGNQQASLECPTDSGMNDTYFSRQNSHLCEHDKQLQSNIQTLPKFSNTFPNKIQPQNQFVANNTNKFSHKFFPAQQQSNYPGAPYQTNNRIPHNIITPNHSQFPMENTMKNFTGSKRHLDPINHIGPQTKRFSASPASNLPISSNQTSSMQYQKDVLHSNHIIRGPHQQLPNYVSGRKLSANIYHNYSNQMPTHDFTAFNHVPIQNSDFHTNTQPPVEQSEH